MVRKVLPVVCLFVALSVSAASPEEAIKAQGAAWVAAFNAGDSKAIGAFYTADGLLMPPNAAAVKGSDAIAALMTPYFAGDSRMSIAIDTTNLVVHGDMAHRVGTWVMSGPDGKAVDNGKYIELWKKSGDRWQMTHDIWNSDMPASPAPAH